MSREAFLKQVREAVRRGNAHRVHIEPFPERTGYVGAEGDLCIAMAAEVQAVGGEATIVRGSQEARQAISQLIRMHQVQRAVCWQHPQLAALDVSSLLAADGVDARDFEQLRTLSAAEARAFVLDADLGITSTDWAIAETGSLMLCAAPGRERLTSLLPARHLAIVFEEQIVPDLLDAFEHVRAAYPDELPSNIVLVTGPSKTGDIELQLTTGVHGPGHWHVLIVRDA